MHYRSNMWLLVCLLVRLLCVSLNTGVRRLKHERVELYTNPSVVLLLLYSLRKLLAILEYVHQNRDFTPILYFAPRTRPSNWYGWYAQLLVI